MLIDERAPPDGRANRAITIEQRLAEVVFLTIMAAPSGNGARRNVAKAYRLGQWREE